MMSYATPVETIFVTGGGRGIGRAVALDLAQTSSASLVLVSRTDTCLAVATECNAIRAAAARAIPCDLSVAGPQRDELFAAINAAPGPIGIVHAAGTLGPTGPFAESSIDACWSALEANLGATLRLVHAALPRMLRDQSGRLVLFGGGGAAYGYPNFMSYALSKVALVRFVETLAMELGENGPAITIIAPGANDTDMLSEVRRAGGMVKTTVSIDEPCRLVRRLLFEDARGLHGRFVHVRDTWSSESARELSADHWKLRRVEK
jgi:NAD(P)-dependent dehydrogenase (short-subunit alcohol dehydrogenase family)